MLFNYLFIFMFGSILGYFVELIYRKIKLNKWIKPGVFKGIYLPLYGLGLCICYFLFNLEINILFKFIFSVILLTSIELICGIIFIKYFKIPLWDYSNKFLNYKGLICFKFSTCWGMLSFFLCLFVFPYVDLSFFNIRIVVLFLYTFYVVIVSDILYTLFNLIFLKNK